MAKGDRRHSLKMRQRKARLKKKARKSLQKGIKPKAKSR